ncbi:GtrA family protein [Erythrobacter sp. SCSIO 43205]|uniref:GtrA family protein n=1 Tax=Erythrobacter sp. SCSIO 43205 TaxID=2779361 RepID=UPI001CAA0ADB|nr:GtrA family protein [Erythrobacter sp. SCSIO 43205]UAB78549.1 GtrA family protein [Erythrobacter sp. SCSIO 43205]
MRYRRPLIFKITDIRFVRYLAVSVGALAVDFGSFLTLLALGVLATPAAALGYSFGILAHWFMSSRAVFHDRVAERGGARSRQKALFVISALVGLGLTTLIVGAGEWSGIDPRAGKLAAIVISFGVTWMIRAKVVFREEPAPSVSA